MNKPYKVRFLMMYSEDVYYDADGNEVARRRIYNDSPYDSEGPVELTDEEMGLYL